MQRLARLLRPISATRPSSIAVRAISQAATPFSTVSLSPRAIPLTRSLRILKKHASSAPYVVRQQSSLTVPEGQDNPAQQARAPQPAYQLTFTCKPCSHRSSHTVTKQGYHHGTVLIQCPECKNRHVISDHLKIFMDEKSTLEDILARKAGPGGDLSKLIKKGSLGQRDGQLVANEGEEDIEFWDDGTETKHTPQGTDQNTSKPSS